MCGYTLSVTAHKNELEREKSLFGEWNILKDVSRSNVLKILSTKYKKMFQAPKYTNYSETKFEPDTCGKTKINSFSPPLTMRSIPPTSMPSARECIIPIDAPLSLFEAQICGKK